MGQFYNYRPIKYIPDDSVSLLIAYDITGME